VCKQEVDIQTKFHIKNNNHILYTINEGLSNQVIENGVGECAKDIFVKHNSLLVQVPWFMQREY